MTLTNPAGAIWRLQVPVPFTALGDVNCYILLDPDGKGWTALDTGMNIRRAVEAWETAVGQLGLSFENLRQIVLSHSHPDHFGLAGWLEGKCGGKATVLISRREWEIADFIWMNRASARDEDLIEHARKCGLSEMHLQFLRSSEGSNQEVETARAVQPYPMKIEFIGEGSLLEMGGRRWRAIHTPGHADGHLSFFSEDGRIFLAGDQILPQITPNIGFWPGIEPDPLGRYLGSLSLLRPLEVDLLLPGHGLPMETPVVVQGRIDYILDHHAERLGKMQAVVEKNGPSTVLDVTMRYFDLAAMKPVDWPFALVETGSHLEYLSLQSRVQKAEDATGTWKFTLPPAGKK